MQNTTLPMEFAPLQSKVDYIQKVGVDEWSSSCPQCGGYPHQDGTPPDRFRMWTRNKNGNVMGWCRRCSYVWFPDKDKPIKPEEFERWRQEQLERERRIKAEAEIAIKNLESQKIWIKYHEALNQYAKDVIKSWGIADEWAKRWKLGLIEDYIIHGKDGEYHSPAITIPMWQLGSNIPANVKLRTLNPRNANDRYRSIYKMGKQFPFVAFPPLKFDTCLLVEGEKKAMVAAQNSYQDMQVIGIPGKNPNGDALQVFDNFGKVYICLDPDAKIVEKDGKSALQKVVERIGRDKSVVVHLPGKIDDLIVENGLRRDGIRSALSNARKLEVS